MPPDPRVHPSPAEPLATRRRGHAVLAMAATWLVGCIGQPPPPPAADGGSSSSGTTSGGSTGEPPGATTEAGETSTTSGGTTLEVSGGSTSKGSTSTTTDEGTTGSSTDSSESSSGGEQPPYPPCAADQTCPAPYVECYELLLPELSVCTLPCMTDADCLQPLTGTAVPECAGLGGDQCLLDCSGGATCPDGMVCGQPGAMFFRCAWPTM